MEDKKDLFRELETDRLILRKINDSDSESLYENIFNNFSYYKFYYNFPFKDLEEYKKLVEKYKEYYEKGNHFRWCIVEKNTKEIIGLVQLHTKDNINKNCKLAYILSYNHNKKGYMREAVNEVIHFAFNTLLYHRIEAEVVLENEKSISLVENIGMKKESIRRESYLLEDKYYDQAVYTIIKNN